jgi:serine phosphatase RsbU (regulator of sigma subunit)/CheY-like chemotaxis protein
MHEYQIAESDELKILLLEDYPLDAELVKRELLSNHPKWHITHVTDRQHFVEALKNEAPDCVISDFAMPQYSGMEAFFTVKELGIEVPFIIVTGELPEDVAIKCINEGIDDYVIKSSLMRLGVTVQKAVDKKRIEYEKVQISENLEKSDHRYQSIFNNAGVAICEFSVPHIAEIREAYQKDHSVWDNAPIPTLKKAMANMELKLVNEEMLSLFEAEDLNEFNSRFLSVVPKETTDTMRFILNGLALNEEKLTVTGEFLSLKGSALHLKCKTTCISKTGSRYISSWIDLTDVHRSEDRLNKVLSRLEQTVSMRTQELSAVNNKLLLEAKDKQRINDMLRENYIQMTDSIIVAKRIQQLMLPTMQSIADTFSDAFVYLRPRDIVSGDFYWFYKNGNKCWMAAVDCTGHGVPGAFMSMIGSKILNQIIIEQQSGSSAAILQSIDSYVIQEFKQHESGTEVSTGMDISLCCFDFDASTICYSGAYQSLFMIREDELTEYKGNRFSLGGTFIHKDKQFTEHIVNFEEGDCFYMLTDGFVDQFGGPRNKKFTRKRLTELLLTVQGKSMYEQEMAIKSSLQDWKGTYEQIDDILVVGLKT